MINRDGTEIWGPITWRQYWESLEGSVIKTAITIYTVIQVFTWLG